MSDLETVTRQLKAAQELLSAGLSCVGEGRSFNVYGKPDDLKRLQDWLLSPSYPCDTAETFESQ